jgi:diguanylate cyclase (GGDEF)-like protein
MRLRTRITVTFALLVAAILAATLTVVSLANGKNATRQVERELDVGQQVFRRVLDSNRRQLTQAAQVLAADFGFRTAVATGDTETLRSALANHGDRIGASLVILVSLQDEIIAQAGRGDDRLSALPRSALAAGGGGGGDAGSVIVRDGRVYQLVSVTVRSPLPVARVVMGFELDQRALNEVRDVLGLGVTLAVREGRGWRAAGSTLDAAPTARLLTGLTQAGVHDAHMDADDLAARAIRLTSDEEGEGAVIALLSRSVVEARAAFDGLTRVLWLTAALALAVAALASFLLARGVTGPLSRLTSVVDRIGRGEYRVSVEVDRNDEVGVLAHGLQRMRSEVEERDASIRRLAFEDSLTGLVNRTGFVAALDARFAAQAGRPVGAAPAGAMAAQGIAVAIVNLRRFRTINECLGYAVGDEVLRHVGQRLAREAEGEGAQTVARLAADQFAVLGMVDDESALLQWGQQLLAKISAPVALGGQSIDITPVVGLAIGPRDATSGTDLLRCADLASDLARERGTGIAAFGPEIKRPGREQLSLLGDLQRAIAGGELRIALQPKILLATGEVTGAEVLLRWQHPHKGLLGPGAFLPFAERSGYIRHITPWVLRQAAALCAQWAHAGRFVPLSVNISAVDLANPRLDLLVAEAVQERGLAPQLLTLEVTESGFIENPQEALAMLRCLATIGVKLSIDDFGTGYSSLSYIANMPVDEIKIDKSFIDGLESDRALAAVVGSAIDMGHRLGLSVVAEGIEREADARRLIELGCDVAQGYLYARPMAPEAFEAWLVAPDARHRGLAPFVQFSPEETGVSRARITRLAGETAKVRALSRSRT